MVDAQIPLQGQQFQVLNPQQRISLQSLSMQLGEQQRQQQVRNAVLQLNQQPDARTPDGFYTDKALVKLSQIDPSISSEEAQRKSAHLTQVSLQRQRDQEALDNQAKAGEEKRREIMGIATNAYYSAPGTPEQKQAAFKKSITDQTLAMKASGEGTRYGWDTARLDHMAYSYPTLDDAEAFVYAKHPDKLKEIRDERALVPQGQPQAAAPAGQVPLSQIGAAPAPQQLAAETPNSLRDQARDAETEGDRLRAYGTKAGREAAKEMYAKADRLRTASVALEGKTQSKLVPGAPGVLYDEETKSFTVNGNKVTAEQVQKIADAHAESGASNISVGNPIAVVDPKTGKTKMVQFDKHGGVIETDYQPKPDDTQNLSAGYHDRMVEAEKKLEAIGPEGHPDYGTLIAGKVGTTAQNAIMSSKQQQYRQAQEDWVRSKLRKESGAVIGDEEMEREIRVYFPQPGDGADVIKQKKAARTIAIEAMERNAGSAPGLKKDEPGWSDADEKRLMELEEKARGKTLMDKEPRELKGRPGVTIERLE